MSTTITSSRRAGRHSTSCLLSVAAIAERLDVCERTVRRLIQAGHLKPLRVGRCLRISEEDLQTYMAGCR